MAYPNHVQNLLDNLKEVLEVLAIHSKVAGKTPPPLLVIRPTTNMHHKEAMRYWCITQNIGEDQCGD